MLYKMAEGVGFEPTDELPHLLISSQVPLTTQPPFQPLIAMPQYVGNRNYYGRINVRGKVIRKS